MAKTDISERQRSILTFIDETIRDKGFPPTVREIGHAVGLNSPASVHNHLGTLQDRGYIRRDPTKPRAIEVHWDAGSGAIIDRRPVSHVPLVGDVAAGTGVLAAENIEEVMPLPADLTGEGDLFMLRVRGDSMTELGILWQTGAICPSHEHFVTSLIKQKIHVQTEKIQSSLFE